MNYLKIIKDNMIKSNLTKLNRCRDKMHSNLMVNLEYGETYEYKVLEVEESYRLFLQEVYATIFDMDKGE